MIALNDVLREYIRCCNDALRLKQLNMELLETLSGMILWFKDFQDRSRVSVPGLENACNLAAKADLLIDEICSSEPLKSPESLIRRNFTGEESDEDLTKPVFMSPDDFIQPPVPDEESPEPS